MRRFLAIALFGGCTQAFAISHPLALSPSQYDGLGALQVGASLAVDGFPDGYGGEADVRFTRVDVYAPGARLIAVGPDGEHELPRSSRIELIGTDASGNMRVQLAFDPGMTGMRGAGSSAAGAFAIAAHAGANGMQLQVMPAQEALPPGTNPQVIPTEDGMASGQPMPDAFALALAGKVAAATATPRGAVVALDVDHELLVNRFGGTGSANQSAALSWIADLFTTMNVMYQRDLNVTLQQGTTLLRLGATPYVIGANTAASSTDLSNFGTYGRTTRAACRATSPRCCRAR